jgi:glycosyltransferase involved in cell wall biosynthesis
MTGDSRPLVSIVTPTYNQAEYVAETIRSVLAQDYPNIEYVVLDDGSTDDTPAVLRQFDGQVRWERHANMGQSNTLNKGWQQARGEYLGYLSSDDRLLPHAISRLVNAIESHPEVSVVYCDFDLIDKHGQVVRKLTSPDFDHRQLVEELNCQPGVGVLFRRAVFEQTGGWKPELRKIPDFEFWLRASRFGPFLRVPETLSQYRVHEQSASIRPLPYERSMEIVDTMRAYWQHDTHSDSARRSVARAHYSAAKSHAQSGRVLAALGQFWAACRLRPRHLVQRSAWRGLLSSFLIYRASQSGRITGHRR